jgi:hypothetical protein
MGSGHVHLILTAEGQLQTAPNVTLSDPAPSALHSVHPVIASNSNAGRVLRDRFQIQDGSSTDWSRLLDPRIRAAEQDENWEPVWGLLRRMPPSDIRDAISTRSIKMRSRSGWAEPAASFHLGSLVGGEDLKEVNEEQRELLDRWLVDESFHEPDQAILTDLSVADAPDCSWSRLRHGHDETLGGRWLAAW